MSARWSWLVTCSILTCVGLVMSPLDAWGATKLVLVGVALATMIAAHEISGPVRWSAALALVCIAPTAQELVREAPFLIEQLRELSRLFTIAGVLGSIAAAIAILGGAEEADRAATSDAATARLV